MVTDAGMILIMGLTGSGKSRFVNLLRPNAVREGDSLRSETAACEVVKVQVGNQLVYVVDTPGFDDTSKSDGEILEEISSFLGAQYAYGLQLRGIIYLHRITDTRMSGSSVNSLCMFQEICGKAALGNVILCTTMWDIVESRAVGARRQQQLRDEFWSEMIENGSLVRKFDGSPSMAEALICRLLEKTPVVLQIQEDIMRSGKRLEDTTAGQTILPRLESSLKAKEKAIEDLRKQLDKAAKKNDVSQQHQLQRKLDETVKEKEKILATRKRLGICLGNEINEKVEAHSKRGKWKDAMSAFASFAGLTLMIATHIVLPILGVPIF